MIRFLLALPFLVVGFVLAGLGALFMFAAVVPAAVANAIAGDE